MDKIIQVSFSEGKKIDAAIDGITIKTDQPLQKGGEGTAPTPFQLFLSSIVACAGIYVLQFCQSRELSTEDMSLTMTCHFDSEVKRYTKMSISLKLPSGFPEKHKASIVRSMDLCAVKKHIMNPPEFEIKIED